MIEETMSTMTIVFVLIILLFGFDSTAKWNRKERERREAFTTDEQEQNTMFDQQGVLIPTK